MGTAMSSDAGNRFNEPIGIDAIVKNQMVLKQMVQYLEIRDLLTLRQVNVGCDHFIRQRICPAGLPAKEMKSDAEIEKFTSDMANGLLPIPFTTFSLDVTSISQQGIARFLEHRESILELSIDHVPADHLPREAIRQLYVDNNVGAKISQILTTTSRTLRTLRIKFFGDVTLAPEEFSIFPAELEALTTLEGVYIRPNPELQDDLVGALTSRAGNLDHLLIRQHDGQTNFVPNLLERVPNLLYSRDRQNPPSLTLDTNVRVQDSAIFQNLYDLGFSRVRRLNLSLFGYHLCQQVAPIGYGNLFRSLTNLLSLQGESLEELVLVTSHEEEIQESGTDVQIQLPPIMTNLERLVLYFPQKSARVTSPVARFVAGQFPKLTRVNLGYDHGWFRDIVVPTVTSLQVNWDLEMSEHHAIFPGLKALLFYAQNPPTILADMMRREGGRVEVLGCFGLANRVTSPQYKTALTQRVKSIVGDLRIPEEHLLGHLYGMTRFDLTRLDKSLTMWQRGIISFGPKADQLPNWPQLQQFHLSIFTKEEVTEVELLCKNGALPMFKEFGAWLFPNHVTPRKLNAANLGPYNQVTFSIDLGLQ